MSRAGQVEPGLIRIDQIMVGHGQVMSVQVNVRSVQVRSDQIRSGHDLVRSV